MSTKRSAASIGNTADESGTQLNKRLRRNLEQYQAGINAHAQSTCMGVAAYHQFKSQHGLELSYKQFLGLCAYLCALLLHGYPATTEDLDPFIIYYPEYVEALPTLIQSQISEERPRVPSYHEWVQEPRLQDAQTTDDMSIGSTPLLLPKKPFLMCEKSAIITETTLREIWKEYPFTFLRTFARMEVLAKSTRDDRETGRVKDIVDNLSIVINSGSHPDINDQLKEVTTNETYRR